MKPPKMTNAERDELTRDPVAYAEKLLLAALFPNPAAEEKLRDQAFPIIATLKDELKKLRERCGSEGSGEII